MKDADMGAWIVRFSELVTLPLGPTTTVADIANHTALLSLWSGFVRLRRRVWTVSRGSTCHSKRPRPAKPMLEHVVGRPPCPMESSSGSRPSPGLHPVKAQLVKSSAPESGSVCTRRTADRHTSTLTLCWTLFQGCVRCFLGGFVVCASLLQALCTRL